MKGTCDMFKNLFNIQNHPFNRAAKIFGQLRYLDQDSQEYWQSIVQIIELCWEAISQNKHDGDAHVMLANVYLLAAFGAFQRFKPEGYDHNLSRCAAVIYEWKTNQSMYSKEKEQGEKIYREITKLLKEPMPDWMNINLTTDIRKAHKNFYLKAIGVDKSNSDTHQEESKTNDKEAEYARSFLQAASYINQGDFNKAIPVLKAGLKTNPDNPVLHTLLGSCYGGVNRWSEAVEEYQTVLQLDPERHADVHVPLGTAYFNLDQLDKAITEFKIGLSEDPSNTQTRFLLARSYHKQGNLRSALSEYEIILKSDPSQKALIHFGIGSLYFEQDKLDKAIQEFKSSISAEPNEGETHFLLGKCYEAQGEKNMANHEYKIAAKLGYSGE
jgi:Tfp pilus assembly protein PilF